MRNHFTNVPDMAMSILIQYFSLISKFSQISFEFNINKYQSASYFISTLDRLFLMKYDGLRFIFVYIALIDEIIKISLTDDC
jgi:hypothetical protein